MGPSGHLNKDAPGPARPAGHPARAGGPGSASGAHRALGRRGMGPVAAPSFGLPRWQRRGLLLTLVLLAGSGLPWLAIHYLLGAGAGELPHPLEPWLMRLHGLGAFAGLFAGGVIAGAHVPAGWRVSGRQGTQRGSGIGLCSLLGATVLSAYLLYYFAPEAWRPLMGWVHAGLGTALAGLGFWHARRRLLRQRKTRSDTAG